MGKSDFHYCGARGFEKGVEMETKSERGGKKTKGSGLKLRDSRRIKLLGAVAFSTGSRSVPLVQSVVVKKKEKGNKLESSQNLGLLGGEERIEGKSK